MLQERRERNKQLAKESPDWVTCDHVAHWVVASQPSGGSWRRGAARAVLERRCILPEQRSAFMLPKVFHLMSSNAASSVWDLLTSSGCLSFCRFIEKSYPHPPLKHLILVLVGGSGPPFQHSFRWHNSKRDSILLLSDERERDCEALF